MKRVFILSLVFIFIVVQALAQQKKGRFVVVDTINIYGNISVEDGSKIGYTTITSKSLDNTYQKYYISTICDSAGNFKLAGIKPVDTLSINREGKIINVINHGSRFLTIKIPSQILYLNDAEKPTIVGKKSGVKPPLKFEVDTSILFICGMMESEPTYPGGKQKFRDYISYNLTYPISAVKNNIEGTITVEFKIAKDGTLIAPKIINGLGYGCDEVVLDIFRKSRKWIPGIINGKPVVCTFQTEVVFKLQE